MKNNVQKPTSFNIGLPSRFEGHGFESHPILDGNCVKAKYIRIDFCTQSWPGPFNNREEIKI